VFSQLAGTNLGQSRQIDERQAEDVRRVDFKVDGLPVDALVVSRYPRRLVLNFAPDVAKVVEAPTGRVQKLAPFLLLRRYAGRSVGGVRFVVLVYAFPLAGEVDELEDERPPCHDAAASGEKVSADNVLEDRRLSGRLRADDHLEGLV
jgi:hypothetical protein